MNKHMASPRRNDGADTLFVSSVEKGFRVLDVFLQGQKERGLMDLSLKDISELSGMDKSAVQRFTNTFVVLGYLKKDPHTRRYSPANKLVDFCYTYLISNHITEIAMPRLIEAGKVYDTTVNLCELSGTDLLYVIRIPHERAAYRTTLPGRRVPVWISAGGMTILARLPDDEADDILETSMEISIAEGIEVDKKQVCARLNAARKNGYDVGGQHDIHNGISTAAPVINGEGRAIAAIQIPVYMPRWSFNDAVEKIAPLAIETAQMISRSLQGEV